MPVYFIQAGTEGPIKIGFARDPNSRLNYIATGHYEKLSVRRVVDGDMLSERWLHHHFAHLKIRGEWFTLDAEMDTIMPPTSPELASLVEFVCPRCGARKMLYPSAARIRKTCSHACSRERVAE